MFKMSKKSALMAASALSFAAMGAPAHAFDTIQWDWQLNVTTDVVQDVTIGVTANPVGIAVIENDQVFVGSAAATSTVTAPVNMPAVDISGANSPDDLAKVESTATAVGNNGTIESDISANVDSSQVAGVESTTIPATYDPTTGAELTPEITTSVIQPASFTAIASTTGGVNVQIDNSAQALANNLSIEMDGPTNDDRTLISNNEQISYAAVTSTSTVDSPTVTDFAGLGTMEEPWVSSSATAVGNNLQITVEAPDGL